MSGFVNLLEECDEETALFMEKMQGEEQRRRKAALHASIHNLPYQTSIDLPTLRRLVKRHNQAVAMLREFLEMHLEESDLTKRARKLTGSPK